MTTKPRIYETPRVPSRKGRSHDDNLSVWREDPKDSTAYVEANINKVSAPKTIIVWKHVVSTLLDPNQIHLRAALRKMIVDGDEDSQVQQMIESLKSNPPRLTLFDFGSNADDLAQSDMNVRDRVFLCYKLSAVLEETENDAPLGKMLRYLVFNSLLHEMGHLLHYEPNHGRRKTSGEHLRFKDWFGDNVGIDQTHEERFGEAGYFLEGQLWGGVIEYTFPHVGVEGVINGLYQKPNRNTVRAFKDIGLIVRHPGNVSDTKREQISIDAMAKRLEPGEIIKPFADDELVPMFSMRKNAKEVWTLEDPAPKADEADEGKRRSKRRKLNRAVRSRLAMSNPDDVDILFATPEFAAESFIDEQ